MLAYDRKRIQPQEISMWVRICAYRILRLCGSHYAMCTCSNVHQLSVHVVGMHRQSSDPHQSVHAWQSFSAHGALVQFKSLCAKLQNLAGKVAKRTQISLSKSAGIFPLSRLFAKFMSVTWLVHWRSQIVRWGDFQKALIGSVFLIVGCARFENILKQ